MKEENAAIDRLVDERVTLAIDRLAQTDISDGDKAKVRRELMATQSAWIAYRLVACETVLVYWGGADEAKLEYLNCMREHARSRFADLVPYLSEPAADQ